ncbi:hypothetical protein [Phyllobacterium chamaecytisi]|uniref:hypothetical protein n=1 Tax=Phyllobacterium chamaecytisi TaxID=2876082 RepID=UPI001CC9E446|nr:hypothetical protein [Phyllobacterium sp. KW56]MBZ9603942.1 hypothetical protein [Phyllobacterium sp. KW56]
MISNAPETVEQAAERRRLAERAFDSRLQDRKNLSDQVLSFSNAGMKAPALAAVGGVAALLGFYTANYAKLSQDPANLQTFNSILFWLFLALLFTVMAPGLAYFGQLAYSDAVANEEHSYERPFVRDTKRSIWMNRIGNFFRWFATFVTLAAIICLAIGGWMFLRLI